MKLRDVLLGILFLLVPPMISATEAVPTSPMLATSYQGGVNVPDYWVSEKLDGVRARWDGSRMYTRGGQAITTPAWFTAGWPSTPMEGELWLGRGRFDQVSGLVRASGIDDVLWKQVRFMLFDLPAHGGTFDARVLQMRTMTQQIGSTWLQPVIQFKLGSTNELDARFQQVVIGGGEGLMLHRGNARYQAGRSDSLLKYKAYDDAEARVIAHTPGQGKYAGMLGALVVEQVDGRRFRLGTGFTDAQRALPPPVGSLVTYRYNGLTSKGLPRFARFMRIRHDQAPPDPR